MIIDSIQNGIVIDHISAGKAKELYRILGAGQAGLHRGHPEKRHQR